jgi:predicted  nucleic acid-binding Zn-ribbon protein
LNDQIRDRDSEISELNSQIGNIRCELETCRGNLSATVDELNRFRAASAEESGLLAQLKDLQEVCSGLKAEVESANRETERAKLSLHTSEESSVLLQDSVRMLKDTIEQAEAKISGFDNERDDYIRACKKESESQRLQTEKDFNQRLEEQKEDHASLVSGLRRQKADAEEKKSIAEGKLDSLQAELSKSRQMSSDLERSVSELQAEIAALQVHTCGHEAETSRFEGELRSFRELNDSAAAELQIVRDLIHQCTDNTNKIAEENATKFEKLKEVTGIQLHKVEEDSKIEVRRLKEELASLQKQAGHHLALQDSISRYLRAKGMLGQEDSVDTLFATITAQSLQDPRSNEPDQNSRPSVHFSPTNANPAPLTDKELFVTDAAPLGNFDEGTINPAYLFPDDLLYDSPVESGALGSEPVDHIEEPKFSSPNFQIDFGTSPTPEILQSPKSSNTDQNCSRQPSISFSKSACDFKEFPPGDSLARDTALQPKSSVRAEVIEIPDSQQGDSLLPCLVSSKRKPNVARRRDTLTTSPQAQKSDRLAKHTQITDINIRKTSTYESESKAPEENSRRSSAREPVLGLTALFADGLPDEFSDMDQSMHTDGYQLNRDHGPSNFHSSAKSNLENDVQSSKMPDQHIKSRTKLPKSILKRNISVVPSDRQRSTVLSQAPIMPTKSGTNRGLSKIPSERLRGSRYNRVASGNQVKILAETNKNRATPNPPCQVIMTFSPDIFAITDSPEVHDPRRNALKRSGSILGSHPGQKVAKLQRR